MEREARVGRVAAAEFGEADVEGVHCFSLPEVGLYMGDERSMNRSDGDSDRFGSGELWSCGVVELPSLIGGRCAAPKLLWRECAIESRTMVVCDLSSERKLVNKT